MVLIAVAAYYLRTISQIVFKGLELSLEINSPIGVLLLGEYHKDQYWVLYYLTSILMTYFSLVCHPKSVHILMIISIGNDSSLIHRQMQSDLQIVCEWFKVLMSKIARIYEPKFLLFFMRIAVLIVIIISTRVVFLRK